jgi:transposase
MEHTTIAVDLAKSVFQVAVSRRAGHVDEERRLSRGRFLTYLAQQKPATVVLEACGSAHYWARQLQPLGHAVRLLPAHDVHRYVRRNKTDRTDTKALLEANRNEEIRPVPVKSVEQQAIASLHRLRSTWSATRTARINTVRGLLREFGVIIPVGAAHVVPQVRECLAQPATPIPRLLHLTLTDACEEIRELETRIREVDRQLVGLAQQMPDVALLYTVPGVGLITATALVASVGDIRRFRSGRHFASYLGLTPKEDSTAMHRRLGAISKQGDGYLRMLLIHGARSVLCHAKACANPSGLQHWALQTQQRRGHNIAAVAVGNKLARIVWAVWHEQRPFATRAPVA